MVLRIGFESHVHPILEEDMRLTQLREINDTVHCISGQVDALYETLREWRSDGKEVTTSKTRTVDSVKNKLHSLKWMLSQELDRATKPRKSKKK